MWYSTGYTLGKFSVRTYFAAERMSENFDPEKLSTCTGTGAQTRLPVTKKLISTCLSCFFLEAITFVC